VAIKIIIDDNIVGVIPRFKEFRRRRGYERRKRRERRKKENYEDSFGNETCFMQVFSPDVS
jgi:hypothetical protein